MRVALVCPYDLAAPGGVQVHVTELASVLLDRGHEAIVLGPESRGHATRGHGTRGPANRGLENGGLGRPIRVPYRGTVAPIAPWPLGILRARSALDAFSPDVVHV
ncbi:MAG: glycosyltransferase, partial [Actinomycetota bacterium]